ncbi:MAG: alpha/beta fold hydrolase [Moraxellaceae bacterium]|nr:alpha/beta fold hydrolase [Moraxellaceae bacterium]MDZ4297464.1 alpha/beta fold hydrolase [Moraxellaceae bacterium]MDZ4387389.1 alpha/beta fold hydrolase [Moraxellaceae bacterium]
MVQEQGFTHHGRNFFKAMLIEFGIYLVGALIAISQGASPLKAIIVCIAIFAFLRFLMVLGNVIPTEKAKSPRTQTQQISVFAALGMIWREWIAALKTYPFLFALEPWLMPNNPNPDAPHKGLPIVLVPGFFTNRGYLWAWRRHLVRHGYGQVYAVSPTPVFESIERNAEHVARFVQEVLQDTGAERVVIMGHSMGGQVIRLYLHRFGGLQHVALAIAVGAPFRGTVLAAGKEKLGPIISQLTPSNAWAVAFTAEVEAAPCPIPFINLWSPQDTIVAPQHNSVVADFYGRNIELPGIGHMEMVTSLPVMQHLVAELDAFYGDKA